MNEPEPLPTVHMFWHGPPLSRLERLCMASFIANGHALDLYVYDEPAGVPAGVRVLDASRVLSRDLMFRHRRTGSVGPFADWFRYRLLHEKGGIWADTDVVCLRPLRYPTPFVYAWQDARTINIAILGLPAGHEVAAWMAACCENPNRILPYDSAHMRLRKWRRRVLQGDLRERVRWGEYGPKGFTLAARHFGCADYARPAEDLYPVASEDWRSLFESCPDPGPPWLETSHAVHLWNNVLDRTPGFDKNAVFPPDSPFERLCRRYLRNGG